MGGAASRVIKMVARPAIKGLAAVGRGAFSSAKVAAKNIAQTAITNAASGATEALASGDVKGAAKKAWSATKSTAITSAKDEFAKAKTSAKAEATKRIAEIHKAAVTKARGSGASIGAGWGKAQAKAAERQIHKHINKIFAGAHKHVRASRKHVRKHGKKGAKAMKKKTTSVVNDLHKEAGAGFKAHLGKLSTKLKGAGVKVGAGLKKKRGSGAAIGAGDLDKKKKRGSGYKAKSGGCM